MRGRLLAVLVLIGVTGPAAAQGRRAVASGSAEAAERLAKYRDMIGANGPTASTGLLKVGDLRVGAKGDLGGMTGKVVRVIDDGSALLGVEDARDGKGHYDMSVIVKCPTKGLTEGEVLSGDELKRAIGHRIEVTRITDYKTAAGDFRKVYVLVPVGVRKPAALPGVVKTPAEADEDAAAVLVSGARFHLEKRNPERAVDRLRQAIKDYPNTKGAEEARKVLKELGED